MSGWIQRRDLDGFDERERYSTTLFTQVKSVVAERIEWVHRGGGGVHILKLLALILDIGVGGREGLKNLWF